MPFFGGQSGLLGDSEKGCKTHRENQYSSRGNNCVCCWEILGFSLQSVNITVFPQNIQKVSLRGV